ncbi:hypothetical protein [Roseofilum sp. Guam]|uniref:hypothetical protein n=1 Tax=Roseofilum sp. Guam TaxID=2821502 RepID=UPI001B09C480|nr:hypothetical protein [Roseofilum sp. Guam]MBP0029259.1 hypothetical protein [Roseofilum sp. Guam]
MTLEQVFKLAKQLSLIDKVRLIEKITPEIEREVAQTTLIPQRSLWGICSHLGTAPSAEDIDNARVEAWSCFPREDI